MAVESAQIREEVLKLMKQKQKIEDEIQELQEVLKTNGVGMSDPLVDADGYPISHIDVYQVRHARQKIICLQNDHTNLMKQIENGLHGYYSTNQGSISNSQNQDMLPEKSITAVYKTPFAKITVVSPRSPAEYCGIQENDNIVEFGSVNATNFRAVTDIAAVVQHSEGQPIRLKLLRGDMFIVITLTPKKWSGKGLLGCNIVPLDFSNK